MGSGRDAHLSIVTRVRSIRSGSREDRRLPLLRGGSTKIIQSELENEIGCDGDEIFHCGSVGFGFFFEMMLFNAYYTDTVVQDHSQRSTPVSLNSFSRCLVRKDSMLSAIFCASARLSRRVAFASFASLASRSSRSFFSAALLARRSKWSLAFLSSLNAFAASPACFPRPMAAALLSALAILILILCAAPGLALWLPSLM